MGSAVKQDVQHPLRNPGYTLLDLLGIAEPAASLVARTAEAGRVAAAGGRAGEVARALAEKPKIAPRELRSGGMTVQPETSQRIIGSTAQKATDTALRRVRLAATGWRRGS